MRAAVRLGRRRCKNPQELRPHRWSGPRTRPAGMTHLPCGRPTIGGDDLGAGSSDPPVPDDLAHASDRAQPRLDLAATRETVERVA